MSTDLLYDQPEVVIILVLFSFLVFAGELGYRAGRRGQPAQMEAVRSQVNNIQTALLGLLALLLGFSFAMAISRFDNRKEMVVRESNAIGTVVLRARLLPTLQRAEVSEVLRRYIEARVEAARRGSFPIPVQQELDAETRRLQDRLWLEAVAAAEADVRSVPAGLFIQAINELIDIKGAHDAALANHVPESVLLLLFGFAILAVGVVGYGNGLVGARTSGVTVTLYVLIALVILVIVDLDRPRRGLILVSQENMINLQQSVDLPKR